MTGRRILSAVLAVVLCIGLLPPSASAAEPLPADEADRPSAARTEDGVLDIGMEGKTARARLSVSAPADLIVAVYDETGGRMLGSGAVSVAAGEEETAVDLAVGAMPAFYVVKAFLLDPVTHGPMGRACLDLRYTEHGGPFSVVFSCPEGTEYAPEAQTVVPGETVRRPPYPIRDGACFGGWYLDEACSQPYDFQTPVRQDLVLFSRWLDPDAPEAQLTEADFRIFDDALRKLSASKAPFEDENGWILGEAEKTAALDAAEACARELLADGTVIFCRRETDVIYLEFASGLTCYYSPSRQGESSGGQAGEVSITALAPFVKAGAKGMEDAPWAPVASVAARSVSSALSLYDCETLTLNNGQVDLLFAEKLPASIHLFLWDGHGDNVPTIGSVLLTGEEVSFGEKMGSVMGIEAARCSKNYYTISVEGGKYYYAVTPSYVRKLIAPRLENALVYLSACQSGTTGELAGAFLDGGADVVFYNKGKDKIITWYTEYMMYMILSYMSGEGPVLEDGVNTRQADGIFHTAQEALDLAEQWMGLEAGSGYRGTSFYKEKDGSFVYQDAKVDFSGDLFYTLCGGLQGQLVAGDGLQDLSGVSVQLTGEGREEACFPEEDGQFSFGQLAAGTYELKFFRDGVPFRDSLTCELDGRHFDRLDPVELSPYTVSFDPNGGNTTAGPVKVPPGGRVGALPAAVRKDALFLGWNTAEDGSGAAFTADTPVTEDLTVYAQWQKAQLCGDRLEWELTGDGTLRISGEGDMWDFNAYSSSAAPWFDDRQSVTRVIAEPGVTGIGKMAFYDCENLEEAVLPDSVTSLRDWAFYHCSSLRELTIPPEVTRVAGRLLFGCACLERVSIPAGVTAIEANAFADCSSLTELTIPAGVTAIGASAFDHCGKLEALTLPSGLREIGDAAFRKCEALTELVIPEGVTAIGSDAFVRCYSLKSVSLPSTLTDLGRNAFYQCGRLSEIELPAGLTVISGYLFADCCSLKKLELPAGVTGIGDFAFAGCSALRELTVPAGVTLLDEYTFSNCAALERVTLPAGLTTVKWYAFAGCGNLKEVSFGGTAQQWASVKIGTGNEALTGAALRCEGG